MAWGKVCVNELREALEAEGVGAGPEATCKGGLGSKGVPRTVILEQPHESTGLGPVDGGVPWGGGRAQEAQPAELLAPSLSASSIGCGSHRSHPAPSLYLWGN